MQRRLSAFVRTPWLLAVIECGLKAVALRRIPWSDWPGQAAAKVVSADNPQCRDSHSESTGGNLERDHGLARGAPLILMLMQTPIAQIVVGLPVEGPFDYVIPEEWQDRLRLGHRVAVSFAHAKRLGIVVGFKPQSDIKSVKPITLVLEEFPLVDRPLLELARLVSARYGCSWGEAIEFMLPKALRLPKSASIQPIDQSIFPRKAERLLIRSRTVSAHWPPIIKRLQSVFERGQGAIILVADSAQIPYVIEQLKDVLPDDAIIHDKKRTPKKELAGWTALKEGKVRVIIGLRTAVFAPVSPLGLIVMYDEDNSSFKEEQSPFYQTREIVLMRSKLECCDVVYVGFSPSVEMLYALSKEDILEVNPEGEKGARRQLIDMTNFASKGPMMISFPLRNSLEKVLAGRGKAMVVINRRGHSTYTRCLFCGHVLRCNRCSSNLVYSSVKKRYGCRQCGVVKDVPKLCPHCKKDYLRSQGTGVERIAQEVKRLFPLAHVERFDREVSVFPKRFDILVTTQAVLRMFGHLKVDGIGVLDIDAEFNRTDYRSSQKAYSVMTHLALMAKGSIEFQTFHVDNEVLRHFVAGRDEEFYKQELALRKELKLPPYAHWVSVMMRSVEEKIVSNQATALYNLMAQAKTGRIEVLNVQPDAIPKLRDQFRYTIFVRGEDSAATLRFVKDSLGKLKKKSGVITTVHVDP